MKRLTSTALVCLAVAIPAAASAQMMDEDARRTSFLEAKGGYGFQLGLTPYVPDGDPGQFKHPITNGFVVGGTAGAFLTETLAAIVTYEYADAASRSGEITGVVDDIDGEISYHSALVGVRMDRGFGPGRLVGQLGAGVIFPFETELEFEYNPALEAAGITGEGSRVSEYGVGVGARAIFGFQLPLGTGLYLGNYLAVETFQSSNDGEEMRLENFVEDFEAEPPEATDAVIEFDADGGPPPNTYPVSSARLQLVIGYEF